MRKFMRFWSMRSRALRSLLIVAGVLMLTAALAPKANAQNQVLIYFNFQDAVIGGPPDFESDEQPAFGGDNPGGGVQHSTLMTTIASSVAASGGTDVNRTAGDIDLLPLVGMGMRTTPLDNGNYIQFHVNATAFSNMSLSLAINTQGNGFNSMQLSYSTNGGATFTDSGGPIAIPSGGGFNAFTFAVTSAVDGQPDVILRITFTGGTSQGNNLQTFIDNIQLTGVPEPTTVAAGLLGVLGLCWHQRRRLIRSVRFLRT